MDWSDWLLGGSGEGEAGAATEIERARRLRQARRLSAAPSKKDVDQDAHIRRLERDNAELKSYFAALVRLLLSKGVVSRQEIADLVQMMERVEKETAPHSPLEEYVTPDVAPIFPSSDYPPEQP